MQPRCSASARRDESGKGLADAARPARDDHREPALRAPARGHVGGGARDEVTGPSGGFAIDRRRVGEMARRFAVVRSGILTLRCRPSASTRYLRPLQKSGLRL